MKKNKLPMLILLTLLVSCSAADVARLVRNVNLEKLGVHVKLNDVPDGMYEKPFVISFDTMLRDISDGAVQIQAYNVYTVGNYDKVPAPGIKEASNFLDPTSMFKDAWFGVYVIVDDGAGSGRRFMLKDRNGRPDDLANLNDRSLLLLPELDQKIISWSSHQNQNGYDWERFETDFRFTTRPGTALETGTIIDRQGRSWRRITGQFDTTAALTDTKLTNMKLFSSIRNYTGLPTKEVYDLVDPWHPIMITGSIAARYFACAPTPFWAVAYYNGSAFTTKQGKQVNTWEQTGLRKIMETMFDRLDVGCAGK